MAFLDDRTHFLACIQPEEHDRKPVEAMQVVSIERHGIGDDPARRPSMVIAQVIGKTDAGPVARQLGRSFQARHLCGASQLKGLALHFLTGSDGTD